MGQRKGVVRRGLDFNEPDDEDSHWLAPIDTPDEMALINRVKWYLLQVPTKHRKVPVNQLLKALLAEYERVKKILESC